MSVLELTKRYLEAMEALADAIGNLRCHDIRDETDAIWCVAHGELLTGYQEANMAHGDYYSDELLGANNPVYEDGDVSVFLVRGQDLHTGDRTMIVLNSKKVDESAFDSEDE